MKKIIGLLVAAIICVGGAFAFNQNSNQPENKEIAQQESNSNTRDDSKVKDDEKEEKPDEKVSASLGEDSNEDSVGDSREEPGKEKPQGSGNANSGNTSSNTGSNSSNTGNENQGKPSEDKEEVIDKEPEKIETVTIAINIHNAINYGILNEDGFGHLPSNGVILGTTTVEIKEGDNVYDVLAKVVRDNGIHMEYTGAGSAIYIQGINNLYEFDCGKYSGWMYEVNGTYPNYGVGAYKLKDGDKITFNYTCDLGADLGQSFN